MNEKRSSDGAGWRSLFEAGRRACAQKRYGEARRLLEAAASAAPPAARPVRRLLANACRMSGDSPRAEKLYARLVEQDPADEESVLALCFILRDQGRSQEAGTHMLKLASTIPDDADRLLRIAGFLRDSNLFDEAIRVCNLILTADADRADVLSMLGRLYQATGRFQEALDCVRAAVDLDPGLGGAWLSLSRLQKFDDPHHEDHRRLRRAASRQAPPETRMCIAFAVGKAMDDLGRWPEAWRQFERGNRLRRARQPWDRRRWAAFLEDRCGRPFRKPSVVRGRLGAVYIVGMLRSGTTLLEQRLDRHPAITGRGELNFLARLDRQVPGHTGTDESALAAIRRELWTQLQAGGPPARHYIDKNPLNFRFLDLLYRVMPGARVIHLMRDGRDSCLSCFSQLFQHADAAFSNSTDDLVDYYRGYRQLMAHWQARFPGWIHTVSYEDLVEDTEQTLRGVLDFLELPWSDAVLETGSQKRAVRTASSWQARQPLYRSSVARWRNYHAQAPAFFDAVAEIDRRFS